MGYGFRGGYMRGYGGSKPTPNVAMGGRVRKAIGAAARVGLRRTAYGAAGLAAVGAGRALYKKFSKPKSIHQKAKANIPGQGSGGTFSTFYMKNSIKKWLVPLKKTGAPNFSYANSAGRLTSPVGAQNYSITSTVFGASDMAALIYSSTTIGRTQRVLLESCTSSTLYRNQSNNDAYLTLYDICARRDMNASDTNNSPNVAWYAGTADTGAVTLSLAVGATPFNSPKFTQFYKVVKVTHIILPAGGTHDHRVNISPMRLVNNEIFQDSQNVGGLTYFTMAVFYGAPVNDATTKTNVSIGSTAIDYCQTKQYRYTYMQDSTTSNYQSSTGFGTITTESIEQDESGLVSTVAQA